MTVPLKPAFGSARQASGTSYNRIYVASLIYFVMTGSWESVKNGSNEFMHIVAGHGWITGASSFRSGVACVPCASYRISR